MAMLSFRCTVGERIKLKALAQSHGYTSLGKYIREQLGLKAEEPKPESDIVPNVETLDIEAILPLLVRHTDVLDKIAARTLRMAKSLGVEEEKRPQAAIYPGYTPPRELPEGFTRA